MSESKTKETIRLDLDGTDSIRLQHIKSIRGFRHNTELIRILINEESRRLGGEPVERLPLSLPRFEHYNKNENGVKIGDKKIGLIADIYFKPYGISCELCQQNQCEHIEFALTVPSIQEIVRKRRKEGWKLPDV